MNIGNVELAIINSVDESIESELDEIKSEIDSVAVKHEASVPTLTISGFINQEVHSGSLSLKEQENRIRGLRTNTKDQNSIDYREFKGYLLVEEVNFIDENNSRIVKEFEVIARYFPWPKYFAGSEP